MKCPKCGSVHTQFVTSTSGGSGFSLGYSCCGLLFLGPLGILCGLCGMSPPKSSEFWVCQNCGHKFTLSSIKRSEITTQLNKKFESFNEHKKKELYENYKAELLSNEYIGSFESIEANYQDAILRRKNVEEQYESVLNEAKTNPDPLIQNQAKKMSSLLSTGIAVTLIIIGLVCSGDNPIWLLLCGIPAILIFAYTGKANEKHTQKLKELYQPYADVAEELDAAKTSEAFWKALNHKVQFIKEYETEHGLRDA